MKFADTYGWNDIQFAVRIRVMRRRCNLSQEELAYRAGVSRNTISSIETYGDAKLSTIVAISNAMRMPMHAWFLPEDEWCKWYNFNVPVDAA